MFRREHGARYCHDDLIGRDRTLAGFDTQAFAAMIDAMHRAVEHDRHAGAVTADQRAIAFEDAIIDPGIVVTVQILHRQAIQIDAADISADGIDKPVPAACRIEQSRSRDVVLALRRKFRTRKESRDRILELVLLGAWKSHFERRPLPRRRGFVDRHALLLRDAPPRITIGRVQPAAAEIERKTRTVDHRPRPAAKTRTRFDEETIDRCLTEPPGGSNAGRATADNHDLDIAARHRRTPSEQSPAATSSSSTRTR